MIGVEEVVQEYLPRIDLITDMIDIKGKQPAGAVVPMAEIEVDTVLIELVPVAVVGPDQRVDCAGRIAYRAVDGSFFNRTGVGTGKYDTQVVFRWRKNRRRFSG